MSPHSLQWIQSYCKVRRIRLRSPELYCISFLFFHPAMCAFDAIISELYQHYRSRFCECHPSEHFNGIIYPACENGMKRAAINSFILCPPLRHLWDIDRTHEKLCTGAEMVFHLSVTNNLLISSRTIKQPAGRPLCYFPSLTGHTVQVPMMGTHEGSVCVYGSKHTMNCGAK